MNSKPNEYIKYTGKDLQEDAYIPRRLVARSCIEALSSPSSIGQIVEITSGKGYPQITMQKAIEGFEPQLS